MSPHTIRKLGENSVAIREFYSHITRLTKQLYLESQDM